METAYFVLLAVARNDGELLESHELYRL